MKLRVQVAGCGERVWSGNALEFDTHEQAAAYARNLLDRWYGADMARVVPVGTPDHDKADFDLADPRIVINHRR